MNPTFITQLDALCAQHGISRSMSNGQITLTDDGAEQALFNREARYLGLEAQDFGKVVVVNGKNFKVVGAKSSRPKYPIDGKCMRSGKVYKLSRGVIAQLERLRSAGATPTPSPAPAPSAPAASTAFNPYADAAQF